MGSHDHLVRQLSVHKGSIGLRRLRGDGLKSMVLVADELLARGHPRPRGACPTRGCCGAGAKMAKELGDSGAEYVDQTEADYRTFLVRIKRAKIKVV